jgi:hypothetical protein
MMGSVEHRHRFDVDSQFHRGQFREAVVEKFQLEPDAHEWIESQLIAKADAADSQSAGLWQANVCKMADVVTLGTEWLWEGYIPRGALSGVSGDPGLG